MSEEISKDAIKEAWMILSQMKAKNPHLSILQLAGSLVKESDFYSDQAREVLSGDLSSRLGAVEAYYNAADESISKMPKQIMGQVSCKKGCAHCCKWPVEVSKAEAEYIFYLSRESNIVIDEAYVREQAKLKDVPDYAGSRFKNCVFLDKDNTCKIYDLRPITCRKYMVTNKSKFCDSERYPNRNVIRVNTSEAAAMGSGLALADTAQGTLSQMLLLVIEENKAIL